MECALKGLYGVCVSVCEKLMHNTSAITQRVQHFSIGQGGSILKKLETYVWKTIDKL